MLCLPRLGVPRVRIDVSTARTSRRSPGPRCPVDKERALLARVTLMRDSFRFMKRFLKSPATVGAIAPSSRVLARAMVADIPFEKGSLIVEFGPGTGAFTREIATRVTPNAEDTEHHSSSSEGIRYLGIEREESFVSLLRERYEHLTFVQDSVENLPAILEQHGYEHVNGIVSGLPFATLPVDVSTRILQVMRQCLAPGGVFATFQYFQSYPVPKSRRFRAQMKELFGSGPHRKPVWANVPPAFVLQWTAPRD